MKLLVLADKNLLGNTRAWLDQGSLLGLTRDGRLIEWDNDIDITCMYDDKPEWRLSDVQELLEHDYVLLTSKYDYTLKKLNATCNEKKLDLTFIREKNGTLYKYYSDFKHQNLIARIFEKIIKESMGVLRKIKNSRIKLGVWMVVNAMTFFYRSYVMKTVAMVCPDWQFELKKVPLIPGLETVCIYERPEEYLKYKFGKDWKIPKREWDYTSEDGALKEMEIHD